MAGPIPIHPGLTDHSRVAPASHPAEALARTGLGHFDHPAHPLLWLAGYRPQIWTGTARAARADPQTPDGSGADGPSAAHEAWASLVQNTGADGRTGLWADQDGAGL